MLEHGLRLAREVAPPTPKGQRGRPWRYDHGLYLALLLFRAFFHLTYRETEALLQDIMEAPFPSHRSLARYAAQRLDPKLLEALLERLSRELEAHLSSRDSPEEDPAPPLPHGHHGVGLPEGGPVSPLPSGSGGAAGTGAGWVGPRGVLVSRGGGGGVWGDEEAAGRGLPLGKPWTAMARAFLELIAYGLRVLLSLLPPPPGYKAVC